MSKNKAFLLSSFIAFFSYSSLVFCFFLYIKESKVKTFSLKPQKTILQLDIIIENNNNKKKIKKLQAKTDDISEKSYSKTIKPTADIKSLFAKVTTKEIKQTIDKKINNTHKVLKVSRFKADKNKQKKIISKLDISDILNKVQAQSSQVSFNINKSDNYDEYFSKVAGILNKNWQPSIKIDDLSAIVLISITKYGKFSYNVKQKSSNEDFNINLEEFLKEQSNIIYPSHDKGKIVTIEVTFKSIK